MTGSIEDPVFTVGQITTDLSDPCGIRTRCYTRDVDSPCFQMHDGEDVEGNHSPARPDFQGGEVDGKQHIPVGLQERGPRWCLLAVGCGLDAVGLQYVAHSKIGDLVVQVLQCSLNSVVSPR